MESACTRCGGTGWNEWFEDDSEQRDRCYHCLTTGKVSDEIARTDKLVEICEYVARLDADDYRRALDNDPEGEDFRFHAAENMMTTRDYFGDIFMRYLYKALDRLDAMPECDQDTAILMYDAMFEMA